MCAYTRNNRRTIVLMVSRKFLGNGTPGYPISGYRYQTKKKKGFTHQSYLEKYFHHREGFVPSSSMHRRIPVQGVSLGVCISRRPPKDIHNCAKLVRTACWKTKTTIIISNRGPADMIGHYAHYYKSARYNILFKER